MDTKNIPKEDRFVKLFMEGSAKLADLNLRGSDSRILFYIFGMLGNQNILLNLNQTSIGKRLDIFQSEVSRSIKRLIDLSILIKDDDGNLFINTDIAQYGVKRNLKVRRKISIESGRKITNKKGKKDQQITEPVENQSLDDFYKELEADEDKTTKIMVEELVA